MTDAELINDFMRLVTVKGKTILEIAVVEWLAS